MVSVPAPPTAQTVAFPLLRSLQSPKTILQVRLTLSAHPHLHSKSLPGVTAPSTPLWKKRQRVWWVWAFTDWIITLTCFIPPPPQMSCYLYFTSWMHLRAKSSLDLEVYIFMPKFKWHIFVSFKVLNILIMQALSSPSKTSICNRLYLLMSLQGRPPNELTLS